MYLAFIIWICFNLDFNANPDSTIIPHEELAGTWVTISNGDRFNPTYKVIISKDSILIKRRELGGSGYTQLLRYKLKNDTLFAREMEYLSFDLNIGSVTRHFKYRDKTVHLIPYASIEKRKLILYPLQAGTVFKKESDITKIQINFKEELSKWRLSNNFKSDYKKNGRPLSLAIRMKIY